MDQVMRKFSFRAYPSDTCKYPVHMVTPEEGYFIHTFFDVKPWSPSGRFLACLKLPFQDRIPGPEDTAAVCMIDLVDQTIREVYETAGWGLQVGAHICWGPGDDLLYFNDKEGDRVYAVEYNVTANRARKLSGPIYQISSDGTSIYGPSLSLINHSQNGYGAAIGPEYDCTPGIGASDDEGLWKTNVKTGEKTLLFTLRQAYEMLPDKEPFSGGRFVFFHTKINLQQNRIMQVVRCVFDNGKQNRFIITMDMEGKDARIALPYELWLPGSHHPDWHPDGERILMNIHLDQMRFCTFGYDGSGFSILCPNITGGGHPSFSPDGRYILTDAYTDEKFVNDRNEVPIRLIDTQNGTEHPICYIWTLGGTGIPGDLRCDPHPVWNKEGTAVCFNGTPNGKRQILIADINR